MSRFVIGAFLVVGMLGVRVGAAPSNDHNVLRTLQSLKEKSLHKRLMNISAMGPEAYKQLQEISFDSDYPPETRAQAFRTAVSLGREQSLPEVQKAAEHRDWFLRALALEAYAHLDPTKSHSLARQLLLNDKALMVRVAALERLQQEPLTAELNEVLQKALTDPKNFHRGQSLWIRGRIAEILLRFHPQKHPEAYQSLLKDVDPKLRAQATARLRGLYPDSWQKIKKSDSKETLAWSELVGKKSVETPVREL